MKNLFNTYCLLILGLLIISTSSCKHKEEPIAENEYYVCSMDPQVMEKQPGPCPICKMPLAKTVIDKSQMHLIKLSDEQMKLGNILIDTVHQSIISRENILTGIFNINQNLTEQVSAKINGRIEQLYYKFPGEKVNVGDNLYELYSRELLLAQEEYLLALERSQLVSNNGQSIVLSAKNKLLLWGLNENQLKELEVTKLAKITNTIYSKASGVISDIPLKEGDYVTEGTTIYRITDLSSLWVEAQLYTNELNYLEEGKKVEIITDAFPDEKIKGKIIFVDPELMNRSKINLVRIEVSNSKMMYKPGMQAYVVLKSDEKKAIVLPSDAVIRNANNNMVWLETEKGKFEPRIVIIGIQNKDKVEILSGINEGEMVVVSGTYLVNSEFIFKRGEKPSPLPLSGI